MKPLFMLWTPRKSCHIYWAIETCFTCSQSHITLNPNSDDYDCFEFVLCKPTCQRIDAACMLLLLLFASQIVDWLKDQIIQIKSLRLKLAQKVWTGTE